MPRPVPLAEHPGVGVENIERLQGLHADRKEGTVFYDVKEYIRRGREVDLIDSKRFYVMSRVDSDIPGVHVRGGTRRAKKT